MKQYITKSAAAAFLLASSVSYNVAANAPAVQDDPSMNFAFGVLGGYELAGQPIKSYNNQELSTSDKGTMSFGAKVGLEIPLTDVFTVTAHVFVDYSSYEQSFKGISGTKGSGTSTKSVGGNVDISQKGQLKELIVVCDSDNPGLKIQLEDAINNNPGAVISAMIKSNQGNSDGTFTVQHYNNPIRCKINGDVVKANAEIIKNAIKSVKPEAEKYVGNNRDGIIHQLSQSLFEKSSSKNFSKMSNQGVAPVVSGVGLPDWTMAKGGTFTAQVGAWKDISEKIIKQYLASDNQFLSRMNAQLPMITSTGQSVYGNGNGEVSPELAFHIAMHGGIPVNSFANAPDTGTTNVMNLNHDLFDTSKLINATFSVLSKLSEVELHAFMNEVANGNIARWTLEDRKLASTYLETTDVNSNVTEAVAIALNNNKVLVGNGSGGDVPSKGESKQESDNNDSSVDAKDNKLKASNLRVGITPAIQIAPFSTDDLSVYFRVGPSLAYNMMSVECNEEKGKAKFVTLDAHTGVGVKYKIAGDTASLNLGLSYDSKNLVNFNNKVSLDGEDNKKEIALGGSTGHVISLNVGFHINI